MRRSRNVLLALAVLASIFGAPHASAGGSVTCTNGTTTYDKSHHDITLLENDGADSVTIYFTVGDTLESSITKGELVLKDTNASTIKDISHTVVAGDLTTTSEPASVNDGVVAWNPTAGDGKLSFKFMHQFGATDKAGGSWTSIATGFDSGASTSCATNTLSTPLANYAVVTIASCCFDSTGASVPGTWNGWSADPGATGTSTNYLKITNTGTAHGLATFTFQTLSVSTPRSATLATSRFTLSAGTGTDPAHTTFVDASGTSVVVDTVGTTWVEYKVAVPTLYPAGAYAIGTQWTVTGPN